MQSSPQARRLWDFISSSSRRPLRDRDKAAYLGRHRALGVSLLRSRTILESPVDPPQDTPQELPPAEAAGEPILTLPPALTAYIILLAVIHLRVLLPTEWENWTIDVFGFIPKRYDSSLGDLTFPGGAGAKGWSFRTYSLLHAHPTQLGFNVLWLLPFGSALARRFGALRFFLFMAVTAVAGGLGPLRPPEEWGGA